MSEQNGKLGRRDLITAAVTGAVIAPVLANLVSSQVFAAGEVVDDSKMVKASDPVASNLKYVENTKSAKDKKEKQGVKPDGQSCATCMFFTAQGKHKNGKDVGKCQLLIASGLVYANGYCSSWAKKA